MKVCFLSLIPMNVDSAATESKVYIITETLQLCMMYIEFLWEYLQLGF